jgi:hypothetical protein
VRENLRKYRTMPLAELIDLSINETLNRTLGTSTTVFLAALPLALFGASLSSFAWVMLFGIVVGTSSSIFIAAPILLLLGGSACGGTRPADRDGGVRQPAVAPLFACCTQSSTISMASCTRFWPSTVGCIMFRAANWRA